MRVVDIIQRTPEWYDWRNQGVTASDACVLMGTDPDRTVWQLWAEKLGLTNPPDLSRNPLVRAGIENEPRARHAYEEKYGALLLPVCGESEEQPTLRASFDGIGNDGCPVELKCSSEKVFKEVQSQRVASDAYKQYYPQLQHQIYVSGAAKGTLAVYHQGEIVVLGIVRNDVFIIDLAQKALAFWESVQNRIEPAKDPDRDLFIPTGEAMNAWTRIADEYWMLERERSGRDAEVKRIEKRQGVLEKELVELMNGFARGAGAGLLVTRYLQQGSVDYRKALDALAPGIDTATLQQYRRPASERVRITLTDTVAKPERSIPLEVAQLCADDGEASLYF